MKVYLVDYIAAAFALAGFVIIIVNKEWWALSMFITAALIMKKER